LAILRVKLVNREEENLEARGLESQLQWLFAGLSSNPFRQFFIY
jgi:hypothetical protein